MQNQIYNFFTDFCQFKEVKMKKTISRAFLLCIVLTMMFLTACNNPNSTSSPDPSSTNDPSSTYDPSTTNDPNNPNTNKKGIYATYNDIIKAIIPVDIEPKDEGEYKDQDTTYEYNKDRQLIKVSTLFFTYTISYNNEGKISTVDMSAGNKDKL